MGLDVKYSYHTPTWAGAQKLASNCPDEGKPTGHWALTASGEINRRNIPKTKELIFRHFPVIFDKRVIF